VRRERSIPVPPDGSEVLIVRSERISRHPEKYRVGTCFLYHRFRADIDALLEQDPTPRA